MGARRCQPANIARTGTRGRPPSVAITERSYVSVPSPVPCRIGINWCQLKGCHGGAQIFASYRAGPKGMLSGWVVTGGTVRYSRGGGAGAWRITTGILVAFAAQELDTCQSRGGNGKVSGTGRR